MKKLGLGIQNLSEFQKNNFIYVDKTERVHSLIEDGKYYFLSRPRRFGKSLLVDTLKEIFQGNRELFEDRWIYDKWDWEDKYPVIKISFAEMNYRKLGLEKALELHLDKLAKIRGLSYDSIEYSGKFSELIEKLGGEKPVAVLIDEYDKPIIDYLEKDGFEQARENRDILKSFYQGIKDLGSYIKFLFITGVSKFSKVSIFSDLNHLTDISVSRKFSDIVGYSEEEIREYYREHLNILADDFDMSVDEITRKIRMWYNGYSWDGKSFLYNPYSVLNLLYQLEFKNYWFETGGPSFLIKQIKENKEDFSQVNAAAKVSESAFNKYDVDDLNTTALMFQTGYLTIKEYDRDRNKYLLDFPNKEVKDSFLNFAVSSYSGRSQPETERITDNLINALDSCDMEIFILELKSLFSSIPGKELQNVKQYEGYYHSIIFIILKIIGIEIQCEVQTNHRITDAVIRTDDYIYVLEFKMGSAQKAVDQIKKKGYCQPYLADKRKLILLGIGFDMETRNIDEFLNEEVEGE